MATGCALHGAVSPRVALKLRATTGGGFESGCEGGSNTDRKMDTEVALKTSGGCGWHHGTVSSGITLGSANSMQVDVGSITVFCLEVSRTNLFHIVRPNVKPSLGRFTGKEKCSKRAEIKEEDILSNHPGIKSHS